MPQLMSAETYSTPDLFGAVVSDSAAVWQLIEFRFSEHYNTECNRKDDNGRKLNAAGDCEGEDMVFLMQPIGVVHVDTILKLE